MSQQERLRKQQQQQQQPSPGRPPRPSDVRQHGFGSPEGMELTDFPSSANVPTTQQSTPQQSLPEVPTTSTESSSPSPPGPAVPPREATPPSAAASPVSPTAEVAAGPQALSPSSEDTPSKPRKRRLFLTPSPRKTSGAASPTASRPPPTPTTTAAAASSPQTTPQPAGRAPPKPSRPPVAAGTPGAFPTPASGGPGRPSSGRAASRRSRPTTLSTPKTGLSGLSTTPRSSRHQSGRRSFNPLNRISDIFSPQSPSFSRSSPDLTPMQHDSSSDDVSSASSDSSASSVKEPFTEQVERLNELLATPSQQLGDLGRTSGVMGEEDDDLDSEMDDLEASHQMLADELSRVDYSFLGGLPTYSSPSTSGQRGSSTPGSSGKRKAITTTTPLKETGEGDEGDEGDDWVPLLPSEANYEPNFSPAVGQLPSPKMAPSQSSSSKKKSPPKSSGDAGKAKSGGRGRFSRFYSPLNTPPREKLDSKRKPPPTTTSSTNPPVISPEAERVEETDSKPAALKSPPKPALSAVSPVATSYPSKDVVSSADEMKTPDRPTTSSSAYSPFNPFGLGTPSPMAGSSFEEQKANQSTAATASDTQVSSLGMGGISEAGLGGQSSGGETGNIFQSIASFADRLAEGSSGSTSDLRPAEAIEDSRILDELNAILTPPRQRIDVVDVESQQRLPAVTPGDRTPFIARRRLDETFDSAETDASDRSSSFINSGTLNMPTDERLETPQQLELPSMLDTRASLQRSLTDEGDSPSPRAFGQDPFVTPPQGRSQLPSLVDETSTAKKGKDGSTEIQSERKKPVKSWGSLLTFSATKDEEEQESTTPSRTASAAAPASTTPSITHAKKQQTREGGEKIALSPVQGVAGSHDTNRGQDEEKETISGTTLFPITQSKGSSMAAYRYPSDEIEDQAPSTSRLIAPAESDRPMEVHERPPRSPMIGSFPSFRRQPTDEMQGDPDKELQSGRLDAPLIPAHAEKDGRSGEETPFRRMVPPILTEDSDDEIIFDSDTPHNERDEEHKVSSILEPDDLGQPKTPMSCETDATPGTVPAKSFSADTAEADRRKSEHTKRMTACRNICIPCGIILVILGISVLVGILIGRNPEETMEPSSVPTSMPSLSASPTSTPFPTGSPSTQPTFSPPSAFPSITPTFIASESPTAVGTVSFTTPYQIYIQNGLVSPVSEAEYAPSLIAAMDILTFDVLDNIQNGGNLQNLRRRKLIGVLLPTEIVQITNVTCPVVTGRDLCQIVVAQIALVDDDDDKVRRFKATTELAIEIGRLQSHLDAIDPLSPVEVVDASWELPAPTPVVQPSLPPPSEPSQSPSVHVSSEPSSTSIITTASPSRGLSNSPSMSPSITRETGVPSPEPTTDLYKFLVENSFDDGIALTVPWSPQGKAYAWLLQDIQGSTYSPQRILQRYTMATFYYATFGDTWLANDFWLSKESECNWYNEAGSRPVCNSNQELVNLELDLNNLSGSLPAELGLLSNSLERITLRGGPSKFLSGPLPPELGYLTGLRVFFVRGNQFSNVVPQEIGNWRNLEQLDLSRNRLAGSLPREIGNFRNLVFFEISANSLTGKLPTEMGLMTKCTQLFFENNNFLSSIPTELGNLRLMRDLKGGANVLLSLPSELGRLTSADLISFSGSNIPGRIPSELGQLQGLRTLELRNNVFEGNIPSELGLLIQLRDQLDLSYNRLSGPIPSELGRLVELRGLQLQHNLLSGQIPSELSQLSQLTSIQLEGNQLSGTTPDAVCTTFNSTYPSFSSDCADFVDNCPCCTTCCADGRNCECRYLNTPREFLCFQQRGS